MTRDDKRRLWLVIVVCCLPLIAHLFLSVNNRPLADDFCFTTQARDFGIWGNVDYMYNNWTGTYSSTFFQSLIGLNQAWWLVPIMLLALWFLALLWLGRQIALLMPVVYVSVVDFSFLFSIFVLYGVVDGTANIFQSLYWTSGAITYTAPVVILTINLSFILYCLRRQNRSPLTHTLVAGLCMLAGGFSPLYAVFQVTVFLIGNGIVFMWPSRPWKKQLLAYLGVGLVFSFIALLILAIAPGNIIRQSTFENRLSWAGIIFYTIRATILFLPISAGFFSPFALLLPLFIGVTVGVLCIGLNDKWRQYFRRRGLRWIIAIVVLGHVIIASCYFTALYSIWYLPPARAYIIPQYVLVLMMFACGLVAGMGLQWEYRVGSRWAIIWSGRLLIGASLLLGPALEALNLYNMGADMRTFADEWDLQDTNLRRLAAQQPDAVAIVAPLTVDLADYVDVKTLSPIAPDNRCVADYYGLKTIRLYEPLLSGR